MDKTTKQVKTPNPTGKGGFKDHPELINPGGRPKNQESFAYWLNYFKNMNVGAFLKWEENNPEKNRTVAADLAYVRVRKARRDLSEFKEIANRTEGMPMQKTDITSDGERIGVQIYRPKRLDE